MNKSLFALALAAALIVGGFIGYLSISRPAANSPAEATSEPGPTATTDPDGVSGFTIHAIPTLSAEQRRANAAADPLRSALSAALGEGDRGDKLTAVQVREDEGSISVTWKADDHFSSSLIRTLVQQDALEIARAVNRSNVAYEWLFLAATFPLDSGEEEIFMASFPASTIDRMDLATMTHGRFVDAAESVFWHTAVQD